MLTEDIFNNAELLKSFYEGSSILVIGGAGSIGSAFIKAILQYKPASITIIDINENALAELTRDLHSNYCIEKPKKYFPYPIGYSTDIFRKIFNKERGFDIIANFAAHKHVRSESNIYSIEALIRNNIIDAYEFLNLISKFPPKKYFCVSTDKAANPVNIMGASKRIMEDLIFSYSDTLSISTARFANVAFSSGSLTDAFLYRIQKRQPLAAPTDIKRYFVAPEESGQICMLSCAAGENREIFFPKLKASQMKSFDEIAINLLEELGYEPIYCKSEAEALKISKKLREDKNNMRYPVYFSPADTTGEKPDEEFYTETESLNMVRFKALGVITQKKQPDKKNVYNIIELLNSTFDKEDLTKEKIIDIIKNYLPNFEHTETGKSLNDKM